MSADPAPDRISAKLGETWNLTSNGHKLYPSGSLTHPMVDGVIALVTGDDIAPGDVTVIDVRVSPPAARFTDLPRPTNRMQAKFSLRHCAAAAAVFRRIGTQELSDEVLARPDVVELRDRVKVVADPALGSRTPTSRSRSPPGGRWPSRCAATAALRRRRSTTTSSARSSASWSARCSDRAHRAAAGHLLAGRRARGRLGAARADRRPMADLAW